MAKFKTPRMCGYSTRHMRRILKCRYNSCLQLLNQYASNQSTEVPSIQSEDTLSTCQSEICEIPDPPPEFSVNEKKNRKFDFEEFSVNEEKDRKFDFEASNFTNIEPSCSYDSASKNSTKFNDLLTMDEVVDDEDTCSENSFQNTSFESNCESTSSDEEEKVSTEMSFEECCDDKDGLLKRLLRNWALKFHITLVALTALLLIFKSVFDANLPLDARTLMGTVRKIETVEMSGGIYHHFGLERAVKHIFREKSLKQKQVEDIKLLINVDGLPISKSGTKSLWLILCSEIDCEKVYPVGVFYGENKPNNANDFIKPFVDEAISLCKDGLKDSNVNISIAAFICDAPAKSFIFSLKGHTGYNSCPYCLITGKCIRPKPTRTKKKQKGRVCFPGLGPYQLKTDEEFAQNKYNDSEETSILTKIPRFGCVTKVPSDYLHLVLLGAMRKEIRLWLHGPRTARLKRQQILAINERILKVRQSIPKEFNRKPRLLEEYNHWKGTEFRTFLLYSGVVVIKNAVPPTLYSNFILLHTAITILINKIHLEHRQNIEYARELLKQYVKNFGKIYGKHYISHNIHNLLHLCDHVLNYGILDNFSAFRFENYMSDIKRMIRKGSKPVEQIAKRYSEIEKAERNQSAVPEIVLQQNHTAGPVPENLLPNVSKQYKILKNKQFTINCNSEKDNCVVLKNRTFFTIKNIIKLNNAEIQMIGNNLSLKESLYSEPDSRLFNIHITDNCSEALHSFSVEDILSKVWKIPTKQGSVVIPLSHSA